MPRPEYKYSSVFARSTFLSMVRNRGETLNVVVEGIETTGAEQTVTGTISDKLVSAVLRDRRPLQRHDHLRLTVSYNSIHVFDAEGTSRLVD